MSDDATTTETVPAAPAAEEAKPTFDFSDEAIVQLATKQDAEGSTDVAAAVEAPTTPTPAATAAPVAEAEPAAPVEEEPRIDKLADGSYLIGGKFKGATLEEAVAKALASEKEHQRNFQQAREQLKQFEQPVEEEDYYEEEEDLYPVQGTDPASERANRAVWRQTILREAQEDPVTAAHEAVDYARQYGDTRLYQRVMQEWNTVEPEQATAFHMHVQAQLEAEDNAAAEQEAEYGEYEAYVEQEQARQYHAAAFSHATTEFQQAHADEVANPVVDQAMRHVIQQQAAQAQEMGVPTPLQQASGNPMMIRMVFEQALQEARGMVGQQTQDAQIDQSKITDASVELGSASDLNIHTDTTAPESVAKELNAQLLGLVGS